MKRNTAIFSIAVLAVLCAAGTGMAQTRVAWGNASGTNNGQYSIENQVLLGSGAYAGTPWECPTTCDVESVLVTIEHNGEDGNPHNYTVAVYGQDYLIIDTTAEQAISANGTAQYQLALMNGFTATAGNLYHVVCWGASEVASTVEWAYSTNLPAFTDSARFDGTTYGTDWPSPHAPITNIAGRRMVGGFIGFTVPAAADGTPLRRRRLLSGGSQ